MVIRLAIRSKPRRWNEERVCDRCYKHLSGAATYGAAATGATGPLIICPNPNCGYRGAGLRRAKGSVGLTVLLFIIGVVPGLLYWLLRGGYRVSCPRCGMMVRDE